LLAAGEEKHALDRGATLFFDKNKNTF